MAYSCDDERWMRYALHLATRGQGRTGQNPAVGCVIVKHKHPVGQGWTAQGGRPHAETQALASAGIQAQGATMYVTLEPCAHYGHTPPCVNAIIANNIERVVVACGDSDSRVAGKGIARLRDSGIAVDTGLLQKEAYAINAGFFRRIAHSLPFISVKIATSLDEKITQPAHRWITCQASRHVGQLLRAKHQAIVTGVGTVLADNPLLTCRLQGLESASPIRVILDRHLRTPLQSAIVQSAHETPTIILTCAEGMEQPSVAALLQAGVTLYNLPKGFGFETAMRLLASKGIHRALIEGGQMLTSAALESGIVNQLYWFRAPHAVGDEGLPALMHQASLCSYKNAALNVYTTHISNDELFTLTLQ